MSETVEKLRHGNVKVSREDWLQAARNTLVAKGTAHVKILTLAGELNVSRSSFYWYFRDRTDILTAILQDWEQRNTRSIIEKCALPSATIGHAVCNFFECFLDDALFDQGLDFAIRDWARRDVTVRAKIDQADARRIAAITELFERHGYETAEADARARILYYMQLGYHALDVREPVETRIGRIEAYLKGFTGEEADPDLVATFGARVRQLKGTQ